jgi:hypothetical protein
MTIIFSFVDGVPAASISISSLGSSNSQGVIYLKKKLFIEKQIFFKQTTGPLNTSALTEFNQELNSNANVREYLMTFTQNLPITTSNSIKLQSSSLAQLTQATNQLTRTTLVRKTNKFVFRNISIQI